MGYYNRGIVIGAPVGGAHTKQFDKWRDMARAFAKENPGKRFAGMGFRNDGTSTNMLSSTESDIADWYGSTVEEPGMAYAVYFDAGKLAEQFLGEVTVSAPRKSGATGLILLVTGGLLGLVTFAAKKKRG